MLVRQIVGTIPERLESGRLGHCVRKTGHHPTNHPDIPSFADFPGVLGFRVFPRGEPHLRSYKGCNRVGCREDSAACQSPRGRERPSGCVHQSDLAPSAFQQVAQLFKSPLRRRPRAHCRRCSHGHVCAVPRGLHRCGLFFRPLLPLLTPFVRRSSAPDRRRCRDAPSIIEPPAWVPFRFSRNTSVSVGCRSKSRAVPSGALTHA